MALIYQAQITPTKLELLNEWVPRQPWYAGDPAPGLEAVGAYRFDDPADEVGIEAHLVRTGAGDLLHVPLTYRGAPLAGGEGFLLGTMEHSVLGQRWIYDACGDPVYASALAAVVLGRQTQAEEVVDVDGRRERREPSVTVTGSGTTDGDVPAPASVDDLASSTEAGVTRIVTGSLELAVRRVLDATTEVEAEQTLSGTWAGSGGPVTLATAQRSAMT